MQTDLVYIAAALLLPLVPAYLLYRTLPAETSVAGPFKGVNIKLSGSFAGYFLLVLVVFSFVYSRLKPAHNYEVYKVKGLVGLDPKNKDLKTIADLRKIAPGMRISLVPPERQVMQSGEMTVEIPVERGQAGELEFPSLYIEHALVEGATVDLDDERIQRKYDIVYDRSRKIITIGEPIVLEEKSVDQPYSASRSQKPQPIGTVQESQPIVVPRRTSYESSLAEAGY
jgi:hypothetical protein